MAKKKDHPHDKSTPDSKNDATPNERPDDAFRLAKRLLRESLLALALLFWRGEFWRYITQRWERVGDNEMRSWTARHVKAILDESNRAAVKQWKADGSRGKPPTVQQVSRSLVSDVLQAVQAQVVLDGKYDQPVFLELGKLPERRRLLSFENSLVDVDGLLAGDANALMPHTPAWFSPVSLPYRYDPTATCPRFFAFLHRMLEGDTERIELIQEIFAYLLLVPDPSRQKFFILFGEGANGKSVLLLVLVRLLGPDNVSHVPLESFGDKFRLAATVGKLANIAAEIGEIDPAAEGTLKAFTSGDPMMFERKYLPPFHARPTATPVFSTNSVPRLKDRSRGIWRRAMVIPFRVTIPPEEQNPKLADQLSEELPGIFNWSLEGAQRLLVQAQFTRSILCDAALAEHQLDSNPARAFLKEFVELRLGGWIECGEMYERYGAYCERQGRKPLDSGHFFQEVRREFPDAQPVRRLLPAHELQLLGRAWGGRRRLYEGIAWKDDPAAPPTPISRPHRLRRPSASPRSAPLQPTPPVASVRPGRRSSTLDQSWVMSLAPPSSQVPETAATAATCNGGQSSSPSSVRPATSGKELSPISCA